MKSEIGLKEYSRLFYTENTVIERITQTDIKLRTDTRIESRRKSNMKIEYEWLFWLNRRIGYEQHSNTIKQRIWECSHYFSYRNYRRKKVYRRKPLCRKQGLQKSIKRFGFQTSACGYASFRWIDYIGSGLPNSVCCGIIPLHWIWLLWFEGVKECNQSKTTKTTLSECT